ncbi:MAG TPA: hypothetical protein VN876_07945 [Gemmatimonadaceae bacterium]|nr:hypothetical protein [Gemmatimonadaceae bacterium]
MRYISTFYAIALAVPTLTPAQTPGNPEWPVQAGSRVRILSPVLGDERQTVTVVSSTSDALVYRQNAQAAPQTLSSAVITHLEISIGTRAHKAKGALIGLVAGAAVGAILGYATWQRPTCKDPSQPFGCLTIDFGPGGDAAFLGGFGGILGAIVGALIGIHQTDNWVPVMVPPPPATNAGQR